ncbi:hypothetical protein E8E13_008275 [Curvularia kusanoi]|uniref:Probable pectate lyase C n=1 Tax=Curvularia kusanoi TaxID=90978 RepID=A0A9P4TAB1_CURKU|nr:hypothetical protein E8E13_008275 [Curvularia kusanoi]
MTTRLFWTLPLLAVLAAIASAVAVPLSLTPRDAQLYTLRANWHVHPLADSQSELTTSPSSNKLPWHGRFLVTLPTSNRLGLENFTVHPETPPLKFYPVRVHDDDDKFALRGDDIGDDLARTPYLAALANNATRTVGLKIVYLPTPLRESFETQTDACPEGYDCTADQWMFDQTDPGDGQTFYNLQFGGFTGKWSPFKDAGKEGWHVYWKGDGGAPVTIQLDLATSIALLVGTTSALAFPGAEGFGKDAIGGRNGKVYVVSNLNDSGAGSLRDAVSQPDRIVVFQVGGLIKIKERIVVSKRISILGQTAPGDGITVYGNGWSFSNADDAIVRYIRIRMGKGGSSGKDAAGIAEGKNMIFDHVSVSWGRDETFSINGAATNITIQNSIIAQGLETHSCGGLMQTELDNGISLFRNLYIDNKTRNPKVKGTNDFINNVVYNWGGGGGYIAGDSSGQSEANIIGNYFISGPSTSITAFTRGNANFNGYVQGNFYDSDKNGVLSGTELGVSSSNYGGMTIAASKFSHPDPAKILPATDALEFVELSVGASKVRDAVDERLIAELKSYGKDGQLIKDETASPMNFPGSFNAGVPWADSNDNGIPDDAEDKFDNVEDWANSLVPSSY